MAQFSELITKVVVDTRDAIKEVATFKNVASVAFKGTAAAAALIGVSLVGVQKAISANIALSKKLQQANFFGASIKQAKVFQKQVGGVLTRMESLAELQKFKQVGFSDKDIATATQLAKKIQVLGGVSLQAALEMIRTGDGVDKLSASLNLDMNTALDNTVKTLTSGVPRASDKARAAFILLQKETKGIKGNFDAMTQADPFKQITVSIKDSTNALLREMSPELKSLTKDIKEVVPLIQGFLKGLVTSTGVLLRKLADMKKSIVGAFANDTLRKFAKGIIGVIEGLKKVPIIGRGVSVVMNGSILGVLKKVAEFGIKANEQVKTAGAAAATQVKKAGQKVNKTLDKLREDNKNRNQKAKSERLQELLDFQGQARSQLRNFQQFALNNISSIGGTISGVIAAMKDTPEQLRILASLYGKELRKTNNLSLEQVLLQRQSGKLSDRQAKVAVLMNTIRKAGEGDQREFLRNQKTITRQLQAGLSISEHSKKLAEIAAAQNDFQTDVQTSQNQLRMVEITQMIAIQRLQEKREKRGGRLGLLDRLSLDLATSRLVKVRAVKAQYDGTASTQKALIQLQKDRATLEAGLIAPLKEKLSLQQKAAQANSLVVSKQQQLAQLQGKLTQGQQVSIAGSQKLSALKREQLSLEIELKQLKINQATAINERERKTLAARVKAQKSLVNAKQSEIVLQQSINKEQSKSLTFTGAIVANIRTAIQATVPMGVKLASALSTAATSFSDAISSSLTRLGEGFAKFVMGVEDADIGKDLGKGFIDLLAGIASNFATVFAGIGATYIAAGNVGMGLATLAGSAGLFALSGAVGALASISDTASSAGAGGASSAARSPASSFQQSLGADSQQQATQEVYVVINSSPWSKTGPQEVKEFGDWTRKNKRLLAGALG